MDGVNVFAVAADALRLHRDCLQRAIDKCVVAGLIDPAAERRKLGAIKKSLVVLEQWSSIAETIAANCDEGGEYVAFFDAEPRHIIATPDASRSYGLKWSIDGETPEDAEKAALLDLAAVLRCRHLQEVQPCL